MLVIDDHDVPFVALFQQQGYTIEKWNDVENIADIEAGHYDIVLLDIKGVGRAETAEEGWGVLKHLRAACPAQVIVVYSNYKWRLKQQTQYFDMADAVMDKNEDFLDFKQAVDDLLRRRNSLGFYVDRVYRELDAHVDSLPRLRDRVQEAILAEKKPQLRQYLEQRVPDAATIDRALTVVDIAVTVASLWKK